MSQRNIRWNLRDLRRRLRELGCEPARVSSSHEIWRMADGTTLPPIIVHGSTDVLMPKGLRVFLAQRGIDLDGG